MGVRLWAKQLLGVEVFFPFLSRKACIPKIRLCECKSQGEVLSKVLCFVTGMPFFSSVNSSQKSFRPHFMIFLGRHMCPKTSFCLSPRKRWKPFAEPCWNASDSTSLSVETCNANKVLPINPLRLYPFMVYSFQFTTFLHIRCIYTVETRNMKSWYE